MNTKQTKSTDEPRNAAPDRLLRRTSAGRRECVLRGRCRSQGERRDGVRMQCNTVAGHDDENVVLRLTRRERQFSRICESQLAIQEADVCGPPVCAVGQLIAVHA